MAATAIMATVTAAVVVVMNTGFSAWKAQEADIDVLENGYGVLRHVARQLRQATGVTAITAAGNTTGSLSFTLPSGAACTMGPQCIVRRLLQQRHEQPTACKEHRFDDVHGLQGRWHHGNDDRHRHPGRPVPGADHAASRRWRNTNADHPRVGPVLVTHMFAKQQSTIRSKRRRRSNRSERGGIALLICLFVLSLVTVWTVDMLESASIYQSALRNTIEYEQALYQANAGVQHVLSQLETDVAWRGTVTAGSYPASGSYSATAVNGRNFRHGGCNVHRRCRRHHAPRASNHFGELRDNIHVEPTYSRPTQRRRAPSHQRAAQAVGRALRDHRGVPLHAAPRARRAHHK